jgi:fatty-acyl-CoA synthase
MEPLMNASDFRNELRRILRQNHSRVLLRIVSGPGFTNPLELTGSDILERAEALAELYTKAAPSQTVLLLLPHSPELFLLHFGLILKGCLPGILAWPTSRIDPEKYQRNLGHQLRHLPAHELITLPRLAGNLAPSLPFAVTPCPIENAPYFEKSLAVAIDLPPADDVPRAAAPELPADALFLQFSGGTTGAQKAVVVTAPMHVAQMSRLRQALSFTDRDGVASWLPMYHDMGLIGCLWFPLWHSAPSIQFSATDWLLNPEMLFYYMDRYQATFCWQPNFAFSYLAGRRAEMRGGHSLAHVRGWINCSEPVRLRCLQQFHAAFSNWGVTDRCLQASYAMAENVFAVTQTTPGSVPATFPRTRVRRLNSPYAKLPCQVLDEVYVSSGRPVEGAEVRIMDGDAICAAGEAGEIQIRTDCLFGGYWGPDGFVRTALSPDGWYSTGDYGFTAAGELFVIGRKKDIVITGGQNIFPEDVETTVNTVEGVYPGRVVAFGVQDEKYGTEALAVVAELRGEYSRERANAVQRAVQKLVLSTIGVAPRHVAVVPEKWIVKSTAGKISRRETAQRFVHEVLERQTVFAPPAESQTTEGQHA